MAGTPAVNPNVHQIADQAKHSYARATKILAETQYRLGELAGLGLLDPDESMELQTNLAEVWEQLYYGTVCAVRDENTDDSTWDEADNTYSDGRQVMVQIRIEPAEDSVFSWEHNRFIFGDGAVNTHLRGTVCYISPINPEDDRVVRDPLLPTDSPALRKRLREGARDRSDDDDAGKTDEDNEIT